MAATVAFYSLATAAIESVFYGIFFSLFCTSLYFAWRRSGSSRRLFAPSIYRTFPFIGGIILFATITPHWMMNAAQNQVGFVWTPYGSAQEAYFADTTTTLSVTIVSLSAIVPFVADIILTYRLWVLWNRKYYIIIFPVGTLTAGVACGIAAVMVDTGRGLYTSESSILNTVCYAMTLSTNAYCSGLIARRLWISMHVPGDRGDRGSKALRVLFVFAESAMLYMGIELVCFVLSAANSLAAWIPNEAMVPITGIAFMLINVLVWSGYTSRGSSAAGGTSERRINVPPSRDYRMEYPDIIHITGGTDN